MTVSRAYRWSVVAMLWFICLLNYADRQLIFTVFPLLGKEFALSDASLSVLSASFMVAYALVGPLGGIICDRVSRRALILGALIFWSLTTFATASARSYAELIAGIALGGVGEAFYFPSAMSMIADFHGPSTRSRAMSLHQSSVYIGSIAGGAIAGYLGQHFGWRLGFRGFGLTGIALGCIFWFFLREPARGQSDAAAPSYARTHLRTTLQAIARNRFAWLLVIVFIGANFVAMVFTVWMPTLLFRKFHMSLTLAGLNGSAYLQAASVLGVISGGMLADHRVRQRRGDRGARMAVQSIGLFCGVPFLLLSGWTSAVTTLLATLIGFGLFKGVYDSNLWAALYDVVPVEQRGTAVGLMNSLGWLGGAAAQLSMGLASERYGMSACLSGTAVIYLVIACILWTGSRHAASRQDHVMSPAVS